MTEGPTPEEKGNPLEYYRELRNQGFSPRTSAMRTIIRFCQGDEIADRGSRVHIYFSKLAKREQAEFEKDSGSGKYRRTKK